MTAEEIIKLLELGATVYGIAANRLAELKGMSAMDKATVRAKIEEYMSARDQLTADVLAELEAP